MRQLKFVILSICLLACTAGAIETQSHITGFELRNCVDAGCVKIQAAEAESGHMTTLLTLKNVRLHYKNESLSWDSGYLDIDRSRLVLRYEAEELVIDLKSLKKQSYKL